MILTQSREDAKEDCSRFSSRASWWGPAFNRRLCLLKPLGAPPPARLEVRVNPHTGLRVEDPHGRKREAGEGSNAT
jgi:hypothetical protein